MDKSLWLQYEKNNLRQDRGDYRDSSWEIAARVVEMGDGTWEQGLPCRWAKLDSLEILKRQNQYDFLIYFVSDVREGQKSRIIIKCLIIVLRWIMVLGVKDTLQQ